MGKFRRLGAHNIITESGELRQGVVELIDDTVVNYYTFTDELPMTEWLGGTIVLLKDEEGILHAMHEGKKIESR